MQADNPAFTLSTTTVTLGPYSKEEVTVTFAPHDAGPFRSRFVVQADRGDAPPMTLSLRGDGTDLPVQVP